MSGSELRGQGWLGSDSYLSAEHRILVRGERALWAVVVFLVLLREAWARYLLGSLRLTLIGPFNCAGHKFYGKTLCLIVSYFCHFLVVEFWPGQLCSLHLIFLICKIRMTVVLTGIKCNYLCIPLVAK